MRIEDHLYKYISTYKKMPSFLKRSIVFPFKIFPREFYQGKQYQNYRELAQKFEYSTISEIQEYQFSMIKELVYHCYNTVPYYRRVWNNHGIDLSSIQSLEDFSSKIPFVTREQLLKNPEDFISEMYPPHSRLKVNTRGTSGMPLNLSYLKHYSRAAEWAHIHILWSRIGYVPGSRIGRLKGDYIGKNQLSTFDPWRNSLILNPLKLNTETTDLYLNLLKKHKVEYINAYPSALFNLIQLSKQKTFPISSLKGIFLSSENILSWQVKKFQNFFQIKNVYHWYGHGEQCALGGGCEYSSFYHFLPTYSFTELIPQSKNPNIDSGFLYEIVGTSFLNPLMPLIRYKTQDLCEPLSKKCSCGREHRLIKTVVGRKWEYALGLNGEKISLIALGFFRHFSYADHITKMQMINTQPGKLLIKIVPKKTFNKAHLAHVKNTFSVDQGLPFETRVELVEKIESTKAGKHRFFIRLFSLDE